jgi:hypothetical protein
LKPIPNFHSSKRNKVHDISPNQALQHDKKMSQKKSIN